MATRRDPIETGQQQSGEFRLEGETPALRMFALLEVIAARDELVTLQRLVEETGVPKPTLHRMLQHLETAGILQRDADGRHYSTGVRLRRLAETVLLNDTLHAARHEILRRLVERAGESCNLTALSGSEVLYLDRVETDAPLRFFLHPGSRVPVHCSASGKLFLAQMTPARRQRLLSHGPLKRYTPNTLTEAAALEVEIAKVREQGYALDAEEFLPGLLCIAVLVPTAERSNLCVALQAPVVRVTLDRVKDLLPHLQQAARDLARIEVSPEPVSC